MSADEVIAVEGLVKRFGSFAALDGLDLRVEQGEVHGFLGPNGSGKSTAIRVLLGLYRSTSGRVRVLGRDPFRDTAGVTRSTSYVPGDVALWDNLTGQEVLDALGGLRGAYDGTVQRRLIDEFVLDPGKKIRTLSKGNRQKVMLIAAFAARTELLILDEPTSGLDPLMEDVFRNCVREAADHGRTVLLSSHILSEVDELCGAVTIIKDGVRVESGRIADMRHLASSTITATIEADQFDTVAIRLQAIGVDAAVDTELRVDAPPGEVTAVLRVLVDVAAADITCTPATLDDLFRRHYEATAR